MRSSSLGFIALRSLACALVLSTAVVDAQEPTAGTTSGRPVIAQQPLTLAHVYAAVDRGTPRIRASEALARAARARVPGATRPPDPTLQFGLMNYMLPELAADPLIGMRQLQLMQMVPLPGKLAAAGRVVRARADAAESRVADARWTARATAAMSFYERWGAERQVSIALETRRLLEDVEAIATSMYRVGTGRQVDVLRARVEIARMDEDVERMRAMSEGAHARLAAELDMPMDSVSGAPSAPAFPHTIPSRDSLLTLAFENRPMLAAGLAEVKAAAAEHRLAARERWPDPQLGVQYAERSTAMGTERMGSLMIGATIPLWAGSRQLRLRDEAAAMREMTEADLAAMRADTRGRVTEVHTALASSRRLATLYRGTVLPQAEAAAASSLSAYRAGDVDFMTVVENRMTVNQYRMELIALDVSQGNAWAELEMLAGRTLMVTP